ncbi:MAG TPA: hypothetical protein VHE80_10275 [Acidimicrobiales bacterium]|nr:hypothetical protein [Acidimicrobiales bacterium]
MAKIVVVLVLLGVAVVELGSPVVTRAQLDGVAHDAAASAAHELFERPDIERARTSAAQLATERGARLTSFSVEPNGVVHVTVEREARSLVLKRWRQAEGWYDVEVDASSTPRTR